MILNLKKFNITEENKQSLFEVLKKCVLDYLTANVEWS